MSKIKVGDKLYAVPDHQQNQVEKEAEGGENMSEYKCPRCGHKATSTP
jgi:predicted RNA-binding Zn-ribbon protein involved in translation (DUF1610 family)